MLPNQGNLLWQESNITSDLKHILPLNVYGGILADGTLYERILAEWQSGVAFSSVCSVVRCTSEIPRGKQIGGAGESVTRPSNARAGDAEIAHGKSFCARNACNVQGVTNLRF